MDCSAAAMPTAGSAAHVACLTETFSWALLAWPATVARKGLDMSVSGWEAWMCHSVIGSERWELPDPIMEMDADEDRPSTGFWNDDVGEMPSGCRMSAAALGRQTALHAT